MYNSDSREKSDTLLS